MAVTRIGVLADTHHPEFLEALPAGLFQVLAGVDLILHAGDVGGRATLEQLERLAPVEAVRGDHDRDLDLPSSRVVEVGGHRIGVAHGNRSRLLEEPVTFLGTVSLGHLWLSPGIGRAMRRRFPEADVVVYGHTHAARVERFDGALVLNPGAVYQVTPAEALRRLTLGPGWFEWCWLQVARHRRRWPSPSIGLLELDEDRVEARLVPLPPG